MKTTLRIVYMGTPGFAVAPLKVLVENGFNIIGVITVPDRPFGRGQKITQSPVKKYASENNLTILQPKNLKDEGFIQELAALKADLQIVVAFRMLPEVVWNMPPKGTFNLHASLLPNYRGAAPIQRAIMNGETETGLTTFFLKHEIDTGDIIFQEKIPIAKTETAGSLHDKMLPIGAELVLKTVKAIEEDSLSIKKQTESTIELKSAPKIFKEDCKINWNKSNDDVYNQIRGLSPYPGAFTLIEKDGKKLQLKIFEAKKIDRKDISAGKISTNKKHLIYIGSKNGAVELLEVQLEGKKRMSAKALLQGFDISQYCII